MSMMGHLRVVSDRDIDHLLAHPEAIDAIVDAEPDDAAPDHLDLDKFWHVLHYVLTGEAWGGSFPAGFLLTGGTPIGEEDWGYGPARAFRASEVATLATMVDQIDDHTLRYRCSGERLQAADIYPGFGGISDADVYADCWAMFQQLRAFLHQAAATQQGLLVYLD